MFESPCEIDFTRLVHLLSDHIVHCPKFKFRVSCPENGAKHENSIKRSETLIKDIYTLFDQMLFSKAASQHKVTFKFEEITVDIVRFLTTGLLLEERGSLIDLYKKVADLDQTGTILATVKSMFLYLSSEGRELSFYRHRQEKLGCDILELQDLYLKMLLTRQGKVTETEVQEAHELVRKSVEHLTTGVEDLSQ
jgi:hypothetical protein